MRREWFPWVWTVIAVLAFAVVAIESASAHDKGCDGNPVSVAIKWTAAARRTSIG